MTRFAVGCGLGVVASVWAILVAVAAGDQVAGATVTQRAEIGAQPSWSPDGRSILFAKNGAIWSVAPSGKRLRRVTTPAQDQSDSSPSWDPASRVIVFERFRVHRSGRAGRQLMVLQASSRKPRVLSTRLPGTVAYPAWSPGRKIVFAASCQVLGLATSNGMRIRLVRQSGISCLGAPSWSPRRDAIAFDAQDFPPQESSLWRVNESGTGISRLTIGFMDVSPDWSPDGTAIVFSRNCRIALLELRGGGIRYLSPARPICATDPDWSPDGTKFVYSLGNALVVARSDGHARRTILRWD